MFLSAYSPDNYRTMIPPRLVLIPNYRFTKSSILMYIKTLTITNCVRFYAKKIRAGECRAFKVWKNLGISPRC